MENMVRAGTINKMENFWKNKTVLITGHTGFKGSWLSLWLTGMGAKVIGYSKNIPTSESHFELLDLDLADHRGDICDYNKLKKCFDDEKPQIVFHLAAQALVRPSYKNPLETFAGNVQGTANVLEACRHTASVKAVLVITSDKCYENQEWPYAYRECDPLGGYDPYSASKGCAEIVASSYARSFFNVDEYGKEHSILAASCRAGNVIGGGDWACDRLIPDIIRSICAKESLELRNPYSTRPWQHVLEPLSGYMLLATKLFAGSKEFSGAWNFGPALDSTLQVAEVVTLVKQNWDCFEYTFGTRKTLHEANLLQLDCSKARQKLSWHGVWDNATAINRTISWYRDYYEKKQIISSSQIAEYTADAKEKGLSWAN